MVLRLKTRESRSLPGLPIASTLFPHPPTPRPSKPGRFGVCRSLTAKARAQTVEAVVSGPKSRHVRRMRRRKRPRRPQLGRGLEIAGISRRDAGHKLQDPAGRESPTQHQTKPTRKPIGPPGARTGLQAAEWDADSPKPGGRQSNARSAPALAQSNRDNNSCPGYRQSSMQFFQVGMDNIIYPYIP